MISILLFAILACCAPHPASLFSAIVLHEGAHLLCALFLRMGKPRLVLGIYGVRIIYPYTPYTSRRVLLALSGSLAGIASGIILCRLPSFFWFCAYSTALSFLNLLPLRHFDGGCVLEAVSEHFFTPDTAWKICRFTQISLCLLFFVFSLFVQTKSGGGISLLALSCISLVATLSSAA